MSCPSHCLPCPWRCMSSGRESAKLPPWTASKGSAGLAVQCLQNHEANKPAKRSINNQLMFCTQFGTQQKTFSAQKLLRTWRAALRSLCISYRDRTKKRDFQTHEGKCKHLACCCPKCEIASSFLFFFYVKEYLNFEKQHLWLIWVLLNFQTMSQVKQCSINPRIKNESGWLSKLY